MPYQWKPEERAAIVQKKKKPRREKKLKTLPCTNHDQTRRGISALKSFGPAHEQCQRHTYNGLTALLHSSLVVRIAEVFGVQERLADISMANRLGLAITQLICVGLRLTLTAFLLFIYTKVGECRDILIN